MSLNHGDITIFWQIFLNRTFGVFLLLFHSPQSLSHPYSNHTMAPYLFLTLISVNNGTLVEHVLSSNWIHPYFLQSFSKTYRRPNVYYIFGHAYYSIIYIIWNPPFLGYVYKFGPINIIMELPPQSKYKTGHSSQDNHLSLFINSLQLSSVPDNHCLI